MSSTAGSEQVLTDVGVPIPRASVNIRTVKVSPENQRVTINSREDDKNSRITKLLRCCIVEFTGDLIFVFMGSLAVLNAGGNLVSVALGHGLCMFLNIAAMGHISGGHFNPAVTLGVLISGNIPIINSVAYILSQLLGGFFGALLTRAVVSLDTYQMASVGITGVGASYTTYPMQPITMEIVMTYLLVFTVLMTAVDQADFTLAPLCIGIAIAVDIMAGGPISGASMNPARSFGPCVSQSLFGADKWQLHYVHWIGPIVGASIAGLVYRLFFANEEKRWLL